MLVPKANRVISFPRTPNKYMYTNVDVISPKHESLDK